MVVVVVVVVVVAVAVIAPTLSHRHNIICGHRTGFNISGFVLTPSEPLLGEASRRHSPVVAVCLNGDPC